MKIKIAVFLILGLLSSGFINAQPYFIKPIASYSFGTNPNFYSVVDERASVFADSVVYSYTYNSAKFSLGAGINYGVLIGKNINKNFSYGIALSYFNGKEQPVKYSSKIVYEPTTTYNVDIKYTNNFRFRSLNLSPEIAIRGNRNTFNPYFKMGTLISFGRIKEDIFINIHDNLPGYIPTERYVYTYQYKPSILFGWYESVGVEFFNDRFLNILLEVKNLSMHYQPKAKVCTNHLYQGEDNMDNLTEEEKVVVFVNSYNPDAINKTTGLQLKQKFSMNSLSLELGIKYFF